jgi:hypothetical protein
VGHATATLPAVLTARAPQVPAWALALGLAGLWLLVAPPTPDLAAQVYRTALFAQEGFAIWDTSWYSGHHMPGYSVLFPPLGALLTPRVVGVLVALASAWAFERLAVRHFGPKARIGVLWFAAATCADLLIGRITYALGVAIGLGALLALQRGRSRAAVGLAALSSLGSPVAGLFVALAGGTLYVAKRDRRGLWLAAAPMVPILVMAVVFPEGGRQPFAIGGLAAVVGFSLAVAALLPPEEKVLRTGAVLYALAAVAAFVLPTPVGSNITRLGATFAGPLLACAVLGAALEDRRRRVLLAVCAGILAWQWGAPLRETAKGVSDPSTQAPYYAGLIGFLEERSAGTPVRIEVPFTRGHWEAVHLARRFPIARGWETQLDTLHNELFFEAKTGGLSENDYRRWLHQNAVRYVALPDVKFDPSGRAEAELIDRGVPYLKPVWSDEHWQVFEVADHVPIVSGGGLLTDLDTESFSVWSPRATRMTVRVRWTPYWTITAGTGCVRALKSGWTSVRSTGPGLVTVRARFSPGRVARRGPWCRTADAGDR